MSLQAPDASGPVVPNVRVAGVLDPLPLGDLDNFVGDPLLGGPRHVDVVAFARGVVTRDGLAEIGAVVRP